MPIVPQQAITDGFMSMLELFALLTRNSKHTLTRNGGRMLIFCSKHMCLIDRECVWISLAIP